MRFLPYLDYSLAMIAVLINCVFILLVLTRTSLAPVYVTFLLNCIAILIWNGGDFMMFATSNQFWFYFSLIGTASIPAFMFHFISVLVGSEKLRGWIIAGYLLCLPLVFSAPLALWHPGIRSFVDGPIWNVWFLMLLIPFFTAGVCMLVRAIRRAKSKNESSRLRYILAAACIACFAGTTDLLQIFKLHVPPLGHLGAVIFSCVLAIGVFKHRAAYDLLARMRTKLDMLNELAAGIAHELRNPLTSIRGAVRLLHDRSGHMTVERSREYLDIVSDEIERLEGILTNYGSLIRPIKIEREPVCVNGIIEKTVALVLMSQDAPRIELSFSKELPSCRSDPQILRQIFLNLIKNAYESCGRDGVLRISTETVPPLIRITFRDSGEGIPPEILPRIFEPFVSTKAHGMGLGLAICSRLVDLSGGSIEAANDNSGACFVINLPAGEGVLPLP